MSIWRTDPDGAVTDRYTFLFLDTLRSEAGKGFTVHLYLYDGLDNGGEKVSLVGEVSCDKKACNSSEGELLQTKVNSLVVELLQPELDRLTAEAEARLTEGARVSEEIRRAKEARLAEEVKVPATKVRDF